MLKHRSIKGQIDCLDEAGIKIHTLSISNGLVDQSKHSTRLKEIKSARNID